MNEKQSIVTYGGEGQASTRAAGVANRLREDFDSCQANKPSQNGVDTLCAYGSMEISYGTWVHRTLMKIKNKREN
ncbi:hypothetical protein I7I48_05111 [Histoplasma ohiense]|nr:hypothetical protein I7I48_05111 [Histoplasma ohiense (nom. inval.)]